MAYKDGDTDISFPREPFDGVVGKRWCPRVAGLAFGVLSLEMSTSFWETSEIWLSLMYCTASRLRSSYSLFNSSSFSFLRASNWSWRCLTSSSFWAFLASALSFYFCCSRRFIMKSNDAFNSAIFSYLSLVISSMILWIRSCFSRDRASRTSWQLFSRSAIDSFISSCWWSLATCGGSSARSRVVSSSYSSHAWFPKLSA